MFFFFFTSSLTSPHYFTLGKHYKGCFNSLTLANVQFVEQPPDTRGPNVQTGKNEITEFFMKDIDEGTLLAATCRVFSK